jgi:hypothetical protein
MRKPIKKRMLGYLCYLHFLPFKYSGRLLQGSVKRSLIWNFVYDTEVVRHNKAILWPLPSSVCPLADPRMQEDNERARKINLQPRFFVDDLFIFFKKRILIF